MEGSGGSECCQSQLCWKIFFILIAGVIVEIIGLPIARDFTQTYLLTSITEYSYCLFVSQVTYFAFVPAKSLSDWLFYVSMYECPVT